LERDGILNSCEVKGGRQTSPVRLEQFRVNDAIKPHLLALRNAGFVLVVTSNQPAVSRGLLPRRELDLMHDILMRRLPVDDILICAHDDPSHPCCKPQPGLFMEGAFKWSLDLDRSFVISDKWQDAKAAQIAGCTSVMIRSPWIGDDHHDFVVPDVESAVRKILSLHAQQFSYAACA
jgi:D-glycero-D-manno-heptose 1,7-bisphosphate phosphatase